MILRGEPSGSPQGPASSASTAAYQVDAATSAEFLAIVDAHGFSARLVLLDAQDRVLIQSNGLSPSDPDGSIDEYLPAGDYTLVIQLAPGAGAYSLTATMEPQSDPFQPLPVGTSPDSIAAGDFTGDNRLDLAVANSQDNTVSVLLGNGDGTFQPQVTYAVGTSPDAIAVGDFNGDGRTDLAVANQYNNTVSVLLGNGDGTFQPQITYAVGNEPDAIVAGDFNGDGRTDLAVVSQGSWPNYQGTVSVLLGNGDGTFQPQVTYAVGASPDAIVAGDFNGDGRIDLAVANENDDTVSVLLGNGDGTFQPQVTYAVGRDPAAIVSGDFTGDGRADLAVVNVAWFYQSNDTVSVLLGNGDGTFQPQVTYTVGHVSAAIAEGDFTGDGHTDLAVTNEGTILSRCCWATATGPFRPRSLTRCGNSPYRIVCG